MEVYGSLSTDGVATSSRAKCKANFIQSPYVIFLNRTKYILGIFHAILSAKKKEVCACISLNCVFYFVHA